MTEMRLFLKGKFNNTKRKAKQKAKKKELAAKIKEMGGTVLTRDSAELLLYRHTVRPFRYNVLRDGKQLDDAKNGKGKSLSAFWGGDWKFLSHKYIE